MPTTDKRNNVLFVGVDKVALAAKMHVTPSYVRQILRRKRKSPSQLREIQRILEDELSRLRWATVYNTGSVALRIELEIKGIRWKNK